MIAAQYKEFTIARATKFTEWTTNVKSFLNSRFSSNINFKDKKIGLIKSIRLSHISKKINEK